jgi:hypothetical protein
VKINQISVFLENKKGRLAEVCSILGANHINIRALTVAESADFGVLRVVVDKPEETIKVLRASSFVANMTDIVAIEVPDEPGGLAGVLKILRDNDLNVEYMYGFVEKFSENALMVFRFEKTDAAVSVLQRHKIHVLNKEDIVSL